MIHYSVVVLAVIAALLPQADAGEVHRRHEMPPDFLNCMNSRKVPYLEPGDKEWDVYSAPYNIRVPVVPRYIALPRNIDEVSLSMECVHLCHYRAQAKSGGHSYASFSSGGYDGEVVVDLREMQEVHVDPRTYIASVDGGLRLGNMALQLYQQRKRAVAHGSCAGVGIGGHFTHGGYGFASRAWGLGLDQIIGMDVVLGNGSIQYGSQDKNTELFYAMRGAADSFGIAARFYLETQPAPTAVVNFRLDASDATRSVDDTVAAFMAVQDFVHNKKHSAMDSKLGFSISLQYNQFSLAGIYLGTLDDFNTKVRPAMVDGLPNATLDARELDWLATLVEQNDGQPLHISEPYTARANFYAESDSPTPYFAYLDLWGGVGSVINSEDKHHTAFPHRHSLWVAQHYAWVDNGIEFPREGLHFIHKLNNLLGYAVDRSRDYKHTWKKYLGYLDPNMHRNKAQKRFFDQYTIKQLETLKSKVDPEDRFKNPYSFELSVLWIDGT
ncbi:hypothetical protein E8E14_000561 [Neopestalotiopsis sp. 37M]|nr:hypothetical protein E8E14_000561 [Neopestalotiopsis sp. 37M]